MQKLNQIVALESGVKNRTKDVLTEIYKAIQHQGLFDGFVKKYQPVSEDGEKFPQESKNIQMGATRALEKVRGALTELFDVTAAKDFANCSAKADVAVDGTTLLTDVPVPYLLFLEKQLTDLHTLVKKIPTLDSNETWSFDPNQNIYRAEPTQTVRTKKVQKAIVLYHATDKHPAQTQLISEDETIGHWLNTKFSAALPTNVSEAYLKKIEKLQAAVKVARESANGADAPKVDVGDKIFNWLFA